MGNPLIEATDRILQHLETIKPNSVVDAEFISRHHALVDDLRRQIDTLLIESHHAQESRRALENAQRELLQQLDELRARLKTS